MEISIHSAKILIFCNLTNALFTYKNGHEQNGLGISMKLKKNIIIHNHVHKHNVAKL